MPIWNVFPRGNYAAPLGIVNEASWLEAQAAAEIRYGKVRQFLGPMMNRDVVVELGSTQILVVPGTHTCPSCGGVTRA